MESSRAANSRVQELCICKEDRSLWELSLMGMHVGRDPFTRRMGRFSMGYGRTIS